MYSSEDNKPLGEEASLLEKHFDTALFLYRAHFEPLLAVAKQKAITDGFTHSPSDIVTLWHLNEMARLMEFQFQRLEKRMTGIEKLFATTTVQFNGKFSKKIRKRKTKKTTKTNK